MKLHRIGFASLALVMLAAVQSATAQYSQPVQWTGPGGNGHWYAVSQQRSTWPAAKALAQSRGGQMACTETSAECVFLRGLHPANEPFIFVGLFQDLSSPQASEPSGGWKWLSNAPFDAALWQQYEPNNMNQDEHYGELEGPGRPDFLNDVITAANLLHFVEWSADCNNDGIVDYGQILSGQLADADASGVPDICEPLDVPADFPTIQAAIDALPAGLPGLVRVAAGTYNEGFSLNGKDVVVRGAPNSATIIDGAGLSTSIARFTGGEPATAGVEQILFRGGTAGSLIYKSASFTVGGAIFGRDSSAFIRSCGFESCSADYGAAVYLIFSDSAVTNCVFHGNTAISEGGGLFLYETTSRVANCTFTGNDTGVNGPGAGSAFKAVGARATGGVVELVGCTITGNRGLLTASAIEYYENPQSNPGVLRISGGTVTGNISGTLIPSGAAGLRVLGPSASCVITGGATICLNSPEDTDGPFLVAGSANVCGCFADVTGDGSVNGGDLGVVLALWGIAGPDGTGDVNHDGAVNAQDLGLLLADWGACPN